MQTTSLELCKKLYELSGWTGADFTYYINGGQYSDEAYYRSMVFDKDGNLPAYDLGYLLRKLPKRTKLRKLSAHYAVQWQKNGAEFRNRERHFEAETPEDCLAKLAIELFKQGILKRGGGDG